MTKHTYTLVVVLTSLIFFKCTDEAQEKQQLKPTQEEISKVILKAVVEEQKKQDEIVRQHYNAQDQSVKENATFREFNLSLALRYKRFTDRVLEEFKNVDKDSDPESQLEDLRESIRVEEQIPDWYWNLREKSKGKVKEIAMQFQ